MAHEIIHSLTPDDTARGLGREMGLRNITAIATALSNAAGETASGYPVKVVTRNEIGLIALFLPGVWYPPCISDLTEGFNDVLFDMKNVEWRIYDATIDGGTYFNIYVAFKGREPTEVWLGSPTPPPKSVDPMLSFGKRIGNETLNYIADQLENHINESLNLETYRCVIPDHGEIQLKINADVTGELVSAVTDVIDDVLVDLRNVSWQITNYGKTFSIHVAVDGPVPPPDYDDEAPQLLDKLEFAAFDIQDRVTDCVVRSSRGYSPSEFCVSVDYEVHRAEPWGISGTLWVSIDFDALAGWEPSIAEVLTIIRTLLWTMGVRDGGVPYIIDGESGGGIPLGGSLRRWLIGVDVSVPKH